MRGAASADVQKDQIRIVPLDLIFPQKNAGRLLKSSRSIFHLKTLYQSRRCVKALDIIKEESKRIHNFQAKLK